MDDDNQSTELDNIKNDFDNHSNLSNNQDRLRTILDFLNDDIFERFKNLTEAKVKLYNRTAILAHYHKSKIERIAKVISSIFYS